MHYSKSYNTQEREEKHTPKHEVHTHAVKNKERESRKYTIHRIHDAHYASYLPRLYTL
jgi:hypothetical protein